MTGEEIIARRRATYAREIAGSRRYDELRKLDLTELRIEARLRGIDPAGLNRQQVIAEIIRKEIWS